ncbi:Hypothetical predicted protein [Octopus vulgaris]|uniref:Uncharacterized protein n=1 Tax=Octopus vulgaris TaxID=6645 RepID=A0AA36B871_OCTVU|nr:Hypothetical predicted protein [Octopus vulgaris]
MGHEESNGDTGVIGTLGAISKGFEKHVKNIGAAVPKDSIVGQRTIACDYFLRETNHRKKTKKKKSKSILRLNVECHCVEDSTLQNFTIPGLRVDFSICNTSKTTNGISPDLRPVSYANETFFLLLFVFVLLQFTARDLKYQSLSFCVYDLAIIRTSASMNGEK